MSPDAPVKAFRDGKAWDAWLAKHQANDTGIWMRIAKKASGIRSITYPEAVEIALCHGWIDGLKRPESESTWLQRFTPRRPRSIWSKINRDKALALIAIGQMRPAGLAEIERAKRDGRWNAAYESPKSATMPADFQKELDQHPKANAFFKTLSRTNSYAIIWRLQTAKKPETRAKRMRSFIEMLEKGETIH
ncbi:MAG: YdeI/OmpD-associated family protein [Gemmatimonadota bacterium]|nr:YdeI/OmpD-associated family protein [Gemmatimonadota bacterium]